MEAFKFKEVKSNHEFQSMTMLFEGKHKSRVKLLVSRIVGEDSDSWRSNSGVPATRSALAGLQMCLFLLRSLNDHVCMIFLKKDRY